MMYAKKIVILLVFLCFPVAHNGAFAFLTRYFGDPDIAILVAQSDLVVRGVVLHVDVKDEWVDRSSDIPVTIQDRVATLRITGVYKGEPSDNIVYIDHRISNHIQDYNIELNVGEHCLLYMSKSSGQDRYFLVDRYFAKLKLPIELPPISDTLEDPLDRLEQDFMNLARDGNRATRLMAVKALGSFGRPTTAANLKPLLSIEDDEVDGWIYWALLKAGDISQLNETIEYILTPISDPKMRAVHRKLNSEIGWLDSIDALPILHRFVDTENPDLRLGITKALRKISSPESTQTLVDLLNDPVRRIRYNAVMALASIDGQKEDDWAPTVPVFRGNEQLYIDHWKKRWKTPQPE